MPVKDLIKTSPESLVSPFRFDLMAKYIYAYFKVNKINSPWAENLYREFLRVLYNFHDEKSGKSGYKSFTQSFDSLIHSISNNGFDEQNAFPVDASGTALDGSHRIAACLAAGKDLTCFIDEANTAQLNYNFHFLASKKDFFPAGLIQRWTDPMAMAYVKLKETTHTICLFTDTSEVSNIDEIYRTLGQPIYEKRLDLEQGSRDYLESLITNEEFKCQKHCKVLLFDLPPNISSEQVQAMLNKAFANSNMSPYISKSHRESVSLCEFFLCQNSVDFFNKNGIHILEKFSSEIRQLKRYLKRSATDIESICLTQPKDFEDTLKIISHKNLGNDFNCINTIIEEKELNKDEMIFNPEKHFYFHGVKFLSDQQMAHLDGRKSQKVGTDKKLILITSAGLCNRLRTICLYQLIADYTGREFKLFWVQEKREQNIRFEDLFTNQGVLIRSAELDELAKEKDSCFLEIYYGVSEDALHAGRGGNDPAYYKDQPMADLLNTVDSKNLIVKTICKFVPTFLDQTSFERDYRRKLNELELLPEIQNKIDEYHKKFFPKNRPIVGVHVRRTDRTDSIEASTDEKFLNAMKSIQSKNPQTMFFLASDNAEVNINFKAVFGNSLIIYEKAYYQPGWERPSTIAEGLIDLMLLSKTNHVLGSLNSSFSLMASKFQNIPFTEIK